MTQPSQKDIGQLFNAIEKGREEEAVATINRYGKDIIEARDSHGRVPLMYAAADARGRVVSALLAQGADINATDREGMTPLMIAIWNAGYSAMGLSVTLQLIDNGADMDAQDECGDTPLMHAIRYDNLTVDLLLEKGADLDLKNHQGQTAEVIAKSEGKEKILTSIHAWRALRGKKSIGRTTEDFIQRAKVYSVKLPLKKRSHSNG